MNLEYKEVATDLVEWVRRNLLRRQTVYFIFLLAILSGLVTQLSIIPNGSAEVEVAYFISSSSISSIADDPLSLPHKLATFFASEISNSVRYVRAISIIFFGLCTVALYRVLKRWHSDKIALFCSVMFSTNATVLAVSRLGTPLVLLFGWSIIISVLLWIRHGSSRKIAPLIFAVVATALLYVPGAPYFFVLLFVIFINKIKKFATNLKPIALYLGIGLGVVIIAPLIYSFVRDINLLRIWLLLPEQIIWSDVPRNILRVPSAFIYRAPVDPLINVGRLPIFDVASGGLFLIGLYAYRKYIRLERTKVMLITVVLSVIIGMLGQVTVAVILLLPFVYSVIGAGVSYVLDEWYGVFPKNPFARSFGLILVTFVILMSVYYQLTRFLVVWPNTPATRAVYNQSIIVK